MPKAQTATKPKPAASRAGARPSTSRAVPKVAPKPAAAKPVAAKPAAPKPVVAKAAVPKGIVPKAPAVHKKNEEKGMASKSAAAVKAKVNDKELPDKEKEA